MKKGGASKRRPFSLADRAWLRRAFIFSLRLFRPASAGAFRPASAAVLPLPEEVEAGVRRVEAREVGPRPEAQAVQGAQPVEPQEAAEPLGQAAVAAELRARAVAAAERAKLEAALTEPTAAAEQAARADFRGGARHAAAPRIQDRASLRFGAAALTERA
jgi:hypothetical protein